jgi:hypothetical protein
MAAIGNVYKVLVCCFGVQILKIRQRANAQVTYQGREEVISRKALLEGHDTESS